MDVSGKGIKIGVNWGKKKDLMALGVGDHFSIGRAKFLIQNLLEVSRSPKQLIFNWDIE